MTRKVNYPWCFGGILVFISLLVFGLQYFFRDKPKMAPLQVQVVAAPADAMNHVEGETCALKIVGRFGYYDSEGVYFVTSEETTTLVYHWSEAGENYNADGESWEAVGAWRANLMASQVEKVESLSGLVVSYTTPDYQLWTPLFNCPQQSNVFHLELGSEWKVAGETATYEHAGIWMQVHANDLQALLGSEPILLPLSSEKVDWVDAASFWNGATATFTFTAQHRQENPGAIDQAKKAMAFASWSSLNNGGVATSFFISHVDEPDLPVVGWLVPTSN